MITTNGHRITLNRTFKQTPDYSAPTIFSMGDGVTSPSKDDTVLENPVTLDITEFKDLSIGYPIVNEDRLEVTFRMFVNTLEANGNDLAEVGILNTDGTKMLYSRDTFIPVNKTNTVELSVVKKDRMVEVIE